MIRDEQYPMTIGRVERRANVSAQALKRRFALGAVTIAIGLFLGMLLFLEVGRQLGELQLARYGPQGRYGVGVADGVVFSLTALLLGFAFSGATSRFDQRRQLIVNEVSAAGTAWQRIVTLPSDAQGEIRDSFRLYVDQLIAWYAGAPGSVETVREPAGVSLARSDLWSRSAEACLTLQGEKARMLLLPSLSDMFVAVGKERMARRNHPPRVIYMMLVIAGLGSSLFAGYALAGGPTRPWLYMLGAATALALAVFVIIQLEFPRLGLVGVGDMDQALVELRTELN
jgi:hypothetical protein